MNNDDQNSKQNLNNNYPKRSSVGTSNVTSSDKANTISDNDNSVEQRKISPQMRLFRNFH